MLRRIVRVLELAAWLAVGAGAQEVPPPARFPAPQTQEQPAPALKLAAKIVVLDVVVTDRQGRLVTGLTRDDFSVFEDRAPEPIRSFEAPAEHALPAGVEVKSAADLKRIGDAPVTLLVLDALNTPFNDLAFCRQALVKYLKAQPAVLGQPAALLLAGNTRFQQLHDYTQNRDELIRAVQQAPAELPNKLAGGRSGDVAVERMAQSLASLEQMAQASVGTPGRKNVIWVGLGFPSANLVGLDSRTVATIGAAVKQCTDLLLAARITMYTINPTANSTVTIDLSTPDDLANAAGAESGDLFAGAVQFQTLAPATGGRAFLSRNDVNDEIAEGIAAGAMYYTLSYAPLNGADEAARYRRIRIVMKDPGQHATTRDGYYPPTAATANPAAAEAPKQARAQLQLDLSSAVNSALAYNGLEVQAAKVGANYVVQVRQSGLDWHGEADGRETAEATILAAWYDGKGKLLGHFGKELTATRETGAAGAQAAFALPVTLPAGAARVRFVVRDAVNGRLGTVDLKP